MGVKGSFFTGNLSYKVVSLFIALILWVTVLGRRDFTVTRNLEVDFLVNSGQVLTKQSSEHVKIRVIGPKLALRKFINTEPTQVITLDLSSYTPGTYDVGIPLNKVEVPFGVKAISIQPSQIQVTIGKK